MSDLLRYVQLDVGGRPSVVRDLNDLTVMAVVRESFSVTAGAKQAIMSASDRRYGGSRQVAETTENAQVTWSALVMGATADACIASVEALLAQVEANPLGLLLEWRPDGASQSALYAVRGTASWTPKYQWVQFAGAQSMVFELGIPVAPLARGLPLDILDGFDVDTRSDYTYDSGASSNEAISGGGFLLSTANVSTEQRAIHTARGYTYADNQQTILFVPLATITGAKAGVVLKRTAATTYIEAYVDDEGTNSRLRIDKVVAGVRTNLATTNLAARIKNEVGFYVRGRIEGNVVTASYFQNAPTPMSAPTTTNSYTLAAGAEQEAFGAGVKGAPGRVWTPKTISAALGEYNVEPYTYRNQTLPKSLVLSGSIPGDAPALADVTVTPSGGAAAPIWALLGWTPKPSAGLAQAPFGIIEAESASNLSGWIAEGGDATTRGGSRLVDFAPSSAKTYTASWLVDPSLMTRDAFTTEVAIEVWARVYLAPTIVTPAFTVSVRPQDGLSYGAARYTDEWGSQGKLLTVATVGVWRMYRLGTLRMLVDPLRPRTWLLWLAAALGPGTSGIIAVDYLMLVPAAARACSPSSKANDSGYPQFVSSAAETAKTIYSDLSARVAKPPAFGHPDHGLGGQLLELPPGEDELLVKLSSLVPDDPTVNATGEQLAHSATIHAAITPRWYLTRSGS